MTVNVVRARARGIDVRVPFGDLDAAVEFGAWLTSRGYVVELMECNALELIRAPGEVEQANRLAALYACMLDSPARAC